MTEYKDGRVNKVYKSINRPLTILGVERKLFFAAAMMGAATFNLMGSFVGGILVFVTLFALGSWATKTDPKNLHVLLNSAKYKSQYCPMKFKPIRIKRITHD
jgi:type IV secretory pathway TrbD component